MNGANLAARVIAAKAVRADFERAALAPGREEDWLPWALRLSSVLESVLGILTGPSPAVTLVLPDGSAFLTGADLLTVLGALCDAAWWQAQYGRDDLAARYRSLSRSLGDDR